MSSNIIETKFHFFFYQVTVVSVLTRGVYFVFPSPPGGERQPRVQPAAGGPVRRGQAEGRGATHHQEDYQRHPEGAQPQEHGGDG